VSYLATTISNLKIRTDAQGLADGSICGRVVPHPERTRFCRHGSECLLFNRPRYPPLIISVHFEVEYPKKGQLPKSILAAQQRRRELDAVQAAERMREMEEAAAISDQMYGIARAPSTPHLSSGRTSRDSSGDRLFSPLNVCTLARSSSSLSLCAGCGPKPHQPTERELEESKARQRQKEAEFIWVWPHPDPVEMARRVEEERQRRERQIRRRETSASREKEMARLEIFYHGRRISA
jgi:hypothetical protein